MVDAQNKYLLITTPLNQLFNIKKKENIIFLGPKQRDLLKKNPMIKDLKIIGTTCPIVINFLKTFLISIIYLINF